MKSDAPVGSSDGDAAPASSLIIPVVLGDDVVERVHRKLDPSASTGLPAHVSALYPFAPMSAITDPIVERIRQCVGSHEQFEVTLSEVSWFGDAVMYLAPSPRDRFVALTSHLFEAFPDYPPYGGAFDEIVPHVTLGQEGASRMRRAARTVRKRLPIDVTASAVLLVAPDASGQWTTRDRFLLAGGE